MCPLSLFVYSSLLTLKVDEILPFEQLHGRTRQQRYSRLADHEYIANCVRHLRSVEEAEDLPRLPFIGNGDAYNHQQFWETIEKTKVDTLMIARGALIKPWIFTEIKERRDWDISARERLDGVRDLVNFGLEHWGTDVVGMRETRRFVLEALSFQHRYIPVGILERFPVQMNERPFPFHGRPFCSHISEGLCLEQLWQAETI